MNYPCPCCGYKTYSEKATGDYMICPVCFWEDDPLQHKDSDYAGGANTVSLKQAQKNFLLFGACTKEMIKNVRPQNKTNLEM
ncbi:MAG: hydrolase [Chitinophagaceae bacterium]|nr:hydrolase [Chitinophagaceae bacterium]